MTDFVILLGAKAVQGQCPFDPCKIKMVGPKNLGVA